MLVGALGLLLSACDLPWAKAGSPCSPEGEFAQDGTYVLKCEGGRWVRGLTIAQADAAFEVLFGVPAPPTPPPPTPATVPTPKPTTTTTTSTTSTTTTTTTTVVPTVSTERLTNGLLAYFPSQSDDGRIVAYVSDDDVYVLDRHTGITTQISEEPTCTEQYCHRIDWVKVAADGSNVLFLVHTALTSDALWIWEKATGVATELAGADLFRWPIWAAADNSESLLFLDSAGGGSPSYWFADTDVAGGRVVLTDQPPVPPGRRVSGDPIVSPSGRFARYSHVPDDWDIYNPDWTEVVTVHLDRQTDTATVVSPNIPHPAGIRELTGSNGGSPTTAAICGWATFQTPPRSRVLESPSYCRPTAAPCSSHPTTQH